MGCCYSTNEEKEELNHLEEAFLSKFKFHVFITNEIRESTFNLINEKFSEEFGRSISWDKVNAYFKNALKS